MSTLRAVPKPYLGFLLAALWLMPLAAQGDTTQGGLVANWSYGWKASPTGGFSPYQHSLTYYGMPAWNIDASGTYPLVAFNNLGATQSFPHAYGYFSVPRNQLVLAPSTDGRASVVRWTADEAGTFMIQGFFDSLDICPTTNVYVVVNGTSVILGRTLNGPLNGPEIVDFLAQRTLSVGDTVDFVVDNGGGDNWCDTVGLAAMITSLYVH